MIAIINYNTGNPNSVANMIKRIGYNCIITSDVEEIYKSVALVIPGVGTFDRGIQNLNSAGLIEVLKQKALIDKTPVLGICLGMHLMFKSSEEGNTSGLGWFPFRVVKFSTEKCPGLKIPQIGWNETEFKPGFSFTDEIKKPSRFYFANAYFPDCTDESMVLCRSVYGYSFVSGVCHDNICGVQFHPEKSHSYGISFFKSFFDKFLK